MVFYNTARFLTPCVVCNGKTNKTYARAHEGKCRSCATGEPKDSNLFVCPDCGERRLTAFQKRNHYHCDSCTRETDPAGYIAEMMTPYEPND